MANKLVPTTTVELGGAPRVLRFDLNAQIDYQKEHKHSATVALVRIGRFIDAVTAAKAVEAGGGPAFDEESIAVPSPLEEIRGVVWASLGDRPRPPLEEVGEWLSAHENMFLVIVEVFGLVSKSSPKKDEAAVAADPLPAQETAPAA